MASEFSTHLLLFVEITSHEPVNSHRNFDDCQSISTPLVQFIDLIYVKLILIFF